MKMGLLLCIMVGFSAQGSDLKSTLDSLVNHSGLKRTNLGLVVTETNLNPLFEVNGEKAFIPASISKLITAAAVMKTFPPDTKFHTQLYIDGKITEGTLNGDLYFKGMGDPAFVSEKMWMLVDDFTRSGIKKITGNLIADDTFFDNVRFDEGRESERNDRAYDAPVGALSFNWNSTTIFVRPGKEAGDPASVFIDPPNSFVSLKSNVTTSSRGTDLRAERVTKNGKDQVIVNGKIAVQSEEKHIYKDISNPPLYAAANLIEFLKQRGITIDGQVKLGSLTKTARLATDQEGEPLSRLVTDMNKFSNNYIAEMLAKNLGAFKTGKQGRMVDGLAQIKNFIKEDLHWSESSFNLANVSGFTRENSFSAHQFAEVLAWVQRQFPFYPEFLQSLPVSGVDGTLHKRMKATAQGWVRAKTGLLTGVVALAGYAGSRDGTVKLFTFIYNGNGDEAHVRDTFDAMASALVK